MREEEIPALDERAEATEMVTGARWWRSRSVWLLAAGLLVVAVLAVATLTDRPVRTTRVAGGSRTQAAPSPSGVPTVRGPESPPLDSQLMMGDAHAPVMVVEFADFQCPYCGEFARTTQKVLIDKYVKAGVVRLGWRDFPYLGAQSENAAVAARAAARQGRFWAYHDVLYQHQFNARNNDLTDARLRQIAQRLGLDMNRFDADMHDARLRSAVGNDFGFGQQLGVPGTPAFLINGQMMFGAQPVSVFEQAVERAKAEAVRGTG